MNNVVLVGRLTKDPELRYVGEKNNALTNFSLAVDRGYKNSQGESKVDFINIEIWGRQAEIFCTYMAKGKMVGIEGKIILILQQYKSLKQGIMIQNLYLIKSMKKENYLLKNYLFREGKYILTNFK